MALHESILDFPQKTLNPNIWVEVDGSYVLRDDAKAAIQKIVDWVRSTFKIPEMNVNLTGSNTSNSYSKDSDIDIHFNSPKFKKNKADEFNKMFRKKFEEFVAQNPELGSINGVKTEIYMQPNPFQDMMSVGCYDFLNDRWIVGPEFKDIDFDPYAEYFTKDMKNVDDVIDDVRLTILKIYELAIALVKTNDQDFKQTLINRLKPLVSKAAKIFTELRAKRTHRSSPSNKEEALANRDDNDWKIADSTFKLLDKFGYLGILRACAQNVDRFDEDMSDIEMAMKEVISTIGEKISTHALDDSEQLFIGKLLEVEQQNESVGSMMKLTALAALMSIGSFLPVNALAKELSKAKRDAAASQQQFTKDSSVVKDAINAAAKGNKMIGEMSKTNVVNAVAQVLWKEARGKTEGTAGRKAVASVILNRADNNPSNIIAVIKEPSAFTCLTGYAGGWTDKTYRWYVPFKDIAENPENKDIWDECNSIALDLVDRKFKSTIGNRNAYINKDTADKSNVDTWGKKCTLKIGSHHFGYLPEHDPKYVVPGTMTTWKKWNKAHSMKNKIVVVKKGDTLGKIAKDNNTTISKILELNKGITNPNKISIGQEIKVA